MKTGKIMKVSFVAALLYCFVAVGTAGAADYVTLGVVRFTSKTPGVSDQQAEIITDVFTRVLANSKSIAVIERERLDVIGKEHKLNLSGLVDTSLAVKVGRLAGCQYMLLGSVTELNQTVSGVRVPLGGRSSALGTNEATATIDMRIVNVTTSELVLALSESGKSSQSGFEINLPGWGFGQGQFGGLEQRAIVAAVSRLGHRIREELGGEYSYVLNSRGRNIQINLGLTSGVKVGDTYLVYSEGEKIFDIDGTFIEREKLNVAVLKVIDVQSGYSLCNVAAEGGKADLIRRGDKIEPIESKRAKAIAKNPGFITERPRSGRGLFEGEIPVVPALDPVDPPDPPDPVDDEPDIDEKPRLVATTVRMSPPKVFENKSTDPAKVVGTYPLPFGEVNTRRIAHINARKLNNRKAYEKYSELAESYSGDYLAAYRAGETALKLGNKNDARAWYDRALAINPNYEPAQKARKKLK